MLLKDALNGVEYRADRNVDHLVVDGISEDSRTVRPGDLFIAKKGFSRDGASYIDDAVNKGARVIVTGSKFKARRDVDVILVDDSRKALSVIADNYYAHPSKTLRVIGITGTNGKTTITYMLESIIKASGFEAGVIGTVNYRIKDSVFQSRNTTPGPLELQSLLSRMVKSQVEFAVIEVSSHSLDQGRADRIELDAAIFTNLTGDHLDYHQTMTEYFAAKKRIFQLLKKGGVAIINGDDEAVASLNDSLHGRKLIFGTKDNADIFAWDVIINNSSTSFIVKTPDGVFKVQSKLIGLHNLSNMLASIAAANALGLKQESIIAGLENIDSIPGRLEAIEEGQPFRVYIDFAHTGDALDNVLKLLRKMAKRRILTVFGCGGNRDRNKRPVMGRVACMLSDHVVITSDNPRYEEPADIISDIEEGIKNNFTNYDIIPDRREAISRALDLAGPDDIVVIAGKGHEDCQIVKDRAFPFDDRKIAKEILRNRMRL